jgi:hypothetical protein
MPTTDTDIAAFVSGGSYDKADKVPSFKFQRVGDKILGTVTRRSIVETDSLNGSGEKQKNLVLEVRSDDEITQQQRDGSSITSKDWTVWFKSPSQILGALGAELKAKGADSGAPREGDRIAVEFYDTEPPARAGHSPKKMHRVSFKQNLQPITNADSLL